MFARVVYEAAAAGAATDTELYDSGVTSFADLKVKNKAKL